MPAKKYVRVKDTRTGHEYDLLEHMLDAKKHELVNKEQYPPTSRPRPAKPNVKTRRQAARADSSQEKSAKSTRSRSSRGTSADKPDPDADASSDGSTADQA